MKNIYVLLFAFCSLFSFAQNINQYAFVIVPTKFDFQKSQNEYRLNTLLKFRLEEYGFKPFYSTDQVNWNERCHYLNVAVVDQSGLFMTKLVIEFKDCNNAVVFQSQVGSSRTKDRKIAFTEALEEALLSVKKLNYKFEGKESEKIVEVFKAESITEIENKAVVKKDLLFAQPILNGFQLVDNTPKLVVKMYKTTILDCFIALSETKNGVIFKKENEWIFEYYVNDKLISEKLNIKF